METAALGFATDGYHTTSVTSIVDRIGVGKGVFYWYFDSKDQLFTELLDDALGSMRQAQREAIAGEPDPARRIELGIEERFAPIMAQGDQQTVADALPHVSAGITAGLLRGEDPVVLTNAILGVTGHLARVMVLGQGLDADTVADAAIAFCRNGYVAAADPVLTRRSA